MADLLIQHVGFHGAEGIVHVDKVVPCVAWLHIESLEGQSDGMICVGPQHPAATSVGRVRAVGESWRGEAGDQAFFSMQSKAAAIYPGAGKKETKSSHEGSSLYQGCLAFVRAKGKLPSRYCNQQFRRQQKNRTCKTGGGSQGNGHKIGNKAANPKHPDLSVSTTEQVGTLTWKEKRLGLGQS